MTIKPLAIARDRFPRHEVFNGGGFLHGVRACAMNFAYRSEAAPLTTIVLSQRSYCVAGPVADDVREAIRLGHGTTTIVTADSAKPVAIELTDIKAFVRHKPAAILPSGDVVDLAERRMARDGGFGLQL